MKAKSALVAVVLLLVGALPCLATRYSTTYNRWPYAAPKSMVTDGGSRLFIAKGDVVREYNIVDPANPSFVQDVHVETSEGITCIVYKAPYILVSKGYKGLERIDSNNMDAPPNALLIYGTTPDDDERTTDDAGLARAVTVSGDKAYVAYTKIVPNSSMVTGLETVSIAGGGSISSLGAGDLNLNAYYEDDVNVLYLSEAKGVVYKDDYAFLADFVNSFVVFDISTDTPVYKYLLGVSSAIDIHHPGGTEERVYIAGSSAGLVTVDISDPENPLLADGYPFFYNGKLVDENGGQYNDVDTDGDPVLDEDGNPVKVNNPSNAQGVFIAGSYAYVAEGNLPDSATVLAAKGIEVEDGVDLVDAVPGLKIIDLTQQDNPVLVETYNTNITGAYSIFVDNDNGFLADFDTGISILDLSDPESPTSSASIGDLPANADAFYLSAAEEDDIYTLYAFALDSYGTSEGMRILKFAQVNSVVNSEFDNISLQSFTETPGEARDVFVGTLPTPESADPSFIPDSYAFVADGTQGLRIYKVTTNAEGTNYKQSPALINDGHTLNEPGTMDAAQGIHSADTSLTFLFVADGANGLQVIRFRPTNAGPNDVLEEPEIVTSIPLPGNAVAQAVEHAGNYAYVAARLNGGGGALYIIDIIPSSSTAYEIVGQNESIPVDARSVSILDNYAYVAAGAGGLQIVNCGNKTSPIIVGSFSTSDANDCWPTVPQNDSSHQLNPDEDTYCYVADGENGIRVIEVTNPADPEEETGWSIDTVGYASTIAVNVVGSRGVVADGKGGLTVLAFTDTDETGAGTDTTEAPSVQETTGCFLETAGCGAFPQGYPLFMAAAGLLLLGTRRSIN